MIRLVDGMTLYHGSYCEITAPDLAKCAPYKDFGSGFYVTSSYQQAKKFIKTSLKKAKSQGVVDNGQKLPLLRISENMISSPVRSRMMQRTLRFLHILQVPMGTLEVMKRISCV